MKVIISYLFIISAVSTCLGAVNRKSNDTVEARAQEDVALLDQHYALVDTSIISGLLFKTVFVTWHVVKLGWSIVSYKLAALTFGIKTALWLINNGISVVLGAAAMFGFCKLTNLCGHPYEEYVETVPYGDLVETERRLRRAIETYTNE